MRYTILSMLFVATIFSACDKVKNSTKNAIDQTAETAGKVGSDIVTKVGDGVQKSLECKVQLSEPLLQAGVQAGKVYFNKGVEGNENVVSIYLIFQKDFSKNIAVKALDEKGVEYGRTSLMVKAKKDSANYFDFSFNKRVNLELKSTFILE
jgi:hypothetical protein